MNSVIVFGVLLFSCLMALSSGQGYIRLSRSDPMMSMLFPSRNVPEEDFRKWRKWISEYGNNEQDPNMMKRGGKNGRRNFLNFIFRKYPDTGVESTDARSKRIPQSIVELRPGIAETDAEARNKRSAPHSFVEQRPIFMETYLRPYFDYLDE